MRNSIISLAGFIFFFTSVVVAEPDLSTEIKNYSGDGKIEDISRRVNFFFKTKGYHILFPKFDLTKNYQATFTIKNLPSFGSPGIYLLIVDNKYWEGDQIKELTTFVEFELLGKSEKISVQLRKQLKDLRWSTQSPLRGFKYGYGLYDLDHLYFERLPDEVYKLRVSYEANEKLAGALGYFYIKSGGSL